MSVRPAPDGMAYLSVLGPLKEVVGAYAAVQARARAVVCGQCAEEGPAGRGVGAVAADTALQVLSGRQVGQPQPVEVHLVVTDRALLGVGDPDRSVMEPARIPGHGSVPAPVARAWLRRRARPPRDDRLLDRRTGVAVAAPATGADPTVATGPGTLPAARGRLGCGCAGCTPPRTGGTWSRWTRGGGCSVGCCAGCWCCVMTCAPPRGARRRSCTPTTPPPVREGGLTGFGEGNGKCARCNQTKEAPGWRTRVITRDEPRRPSDDADRDPDRDGDGAAVQRGGGRGGWCR